MKNWRWLLLPLLLLIAVPESGSLAQSGGKSKQEKRAEKKKEEQKKKAKKAEEEGKKRHRKIQTKNVKKRMKRNDKRYQHIDSYDRRPGFIKKLFPRKRPSAN